MREENDTVAIEKEFNEYLWNTISIRDTSVRKSMKENFYHGIDGCREALQQIRDRKYEESLIKDGMIE